MSGGGLAALAAAGVVVDIGVMAEEAAELVAPFAKLVTQRRPWVIAKWAMTLDGKLAANSGDSRWISGEESRAVVHQLRGRVDAIVVGRGTAAVDDPLLTARPPGPRTPVRVVLDSQASLALDSQLVRTARERQYFSPPRRKRRATSATSCGRAESRSGNPPRRTARGVSRRCSTNWGGGK